MLLMRLAQKVEFVTFSASETRSRRPPVDNCQFAHDNIFYAENSSTADTYFGGEMDSQMTLDETPHSSAGRCRTCAGLRRGDWLEDCCVSRGLFPGLSISRLSKSLRRRIYEIARNELRLFELIELIDTCPVGARIRGLC
jgi:hypothetical protein